MSGVPVIDLSHDDAASALVDAFATVGFAELAGHGVSESAHASLRDQCDQFFALPVEDKLRYVHPAPEANRGFRAKGSEALSYSLGEASPPDLFESFNCASSRRASDDPLMQPTPWPDDTVPRFEAAAHVWLAEMEQLASRLDTMLRDALGFDLAAISQAGPDTMACIDYRPGPGGDEPTVKGQQRMGAHSDYTTFTILAADPVPGLEIVGPSGSWMPVIAAPGNLLVNVGDVLAMLTNDQWPSTLHRVVPMAAGAAPRRRSIAYFHYPDLDVLVEPQPRFIITGEQSHYLPATVADHLLGKLTAPKTRDPATSASTVAGRTL